MRTPPGREPHPHKQQSPILPPYLQMAGLHPERQLKPADTVRAKSVGLFADLGTSNLTPKTSVTLHPYKKKRERMEKNIPSTKYQMPKV